MQADALILTSHSVWAGTTLQHNASPYQNCTLDPTHGVTTCSHVGLHPSRCEEENDPKDNYTPDFLRTEGESEHGTNKRQRTGSNIKLSLLAASTQAHARMSPSQSPITRYADILWRFFTQANLHLVSTPNQASLAKWCLYQAPEHM